MTQSIFNPENQSQDLDSKIVVALERMTEVFKSLQWEVGKKLHLSPMQVQILLFVEYHQGNLCTVSHLAKEFNVTKPTISDTVRVLYYKDLVDKMPDAVDSRSFSLKLSVKGKRLLEQLDGYILPMYQMVKALEPNLKSTLWQSLSQLIFQLNQSGILQVQRMCYNCKHYEKGTSSDYCRLLNSPLLSEDIRLDCPVFESKK